MRRALHLVLLAVLTASVAASPVVAVSGGATAPGDATASTTSTCVNDAESTGTAPKTLEIRSAVGYRLADLDSRDDITAAADRGDLEAGRVAVSDVLVVTLNDATLANDLGTGNATSEFLARTNGSTGPLVVRQRGTCRPPKHLVLAPNVTRVVSAPGDGAVHVVVDLANATMRNEYETRSATEALGFAPEVLVNASLRDANGTTNVERTVAAFQREAQLRGIQPGGPAFRTASPDATFAVETNFAPGREVSFVLRRPDGDAVATATSTVDDDGVARATVSLAERDVGTRLTLSATVAGRNVLEGPDAVRIVEYSATVDEAAVSERTQSVAVTANVSVDAGGFVVLHAGNATGPVLGHSGYLAPGEHDGVTAYVSEPVANGTTVVAVAHVDDRRNAAFDGVDSDPRYPREDVAASVVVGNASLPAPGTASAPERDTSAWTSTPPTTSTVPTTDAPTSGSGPPGSGATSSSSTTTETGSTVDDPAGAGGPVPGFGVVVATLAVLATVALAARRR